MQAPFDFAQGQQTPPAQQPQQPAQAPPATDVYLVSLAEPSAWSASSVSNISASPGYDNQPSFMRDSRSILFASNRDGRQTDIYRYWIADRKLTQLTSTPEPEYSPTLVPAGNGFTVIQVDAENAQRLKMFDLAGRNAALVSHPDEKGVGYHAWIDAETLMMFIVGQPSRLIRYRPGAGEAEEVATGIGRSLVAIPNAKAVSFTTRDDNGVWWFKRYDAGTKEITTIGQAPEGLTGEPYVAWTRDGRMFSAAGTKIFVRKADDAGWTLVGDLGVAPIRNISRLSVSPDGRWLAFVADPAPSEPLDLSW